MIDSLALQTLRNSEFLRFLKNVLSIYLLHNPGDLKVQEQYDKVSQMIATLVHYLRPTRQPLTDELMALDVRRDNGITGIGMYITSMNYYFDETIKRHASLLADHLAVYGKSIARESYQSETELINGIISDWTAKPELAAAVTALRLDDWKAELAAVNTEFDDKYIVRTRQIGGASPDKMKAKRLEAANAYYDLRDFTESYYTISKGA